MLKKLLSASDCKKCQICCEFDDDDLWEAPIISKQLKHDILENYPDTKFTEFNGNTILDMDKTNDDYVCSMLDRKTGCILGSDKPFDCQIWPFRIMNFNGQRVITVSPVCPVVSSRPLCEISDVCEEFSRKLFDFTSNHPEYVKPYQQGYPIIAVEDSLD